jgi:hypothetical protein
LIYIGIPIIRSIIRMANTYKTDNGNDSHLALGLTRLDSTSSPDSFGTYTHTTNGLILSFDDAYD